MCFVQKTTERVKKIGQALTTILLNYCFQKSHCDKVLLCKNRISVKEKKVITLHIKAKI